MEFDFNKIKDGLKNTFNKTADLTVKYTGKAVSFTKLKVKESDTRNKISDLYKNIGELVYKSVKEETDIPEELNTLIEKIDELKVMLNSCNEELESLK